MMVLFFGLVTAGVPESKKAYAGATVAPSTCSNCPFGSPLCVPTGYTEISAEAIYSAFESYIQDEYNDLSDWLAEQWDNFVEDVLDGINDILEGQFMEWQDSLWAYDLRPALQNHMGQINTGYVDQSRQAGSNLDGTLLNEHVEAIAEQEKKARERYRPSEQLCVSGSLAGSFPRSNAFSRGFRQASERDTIASETNKAGSKYENGPIQAINYQWNRYCQNLVDPNNNDGMTGCPAAMSPPPAETRNADIEPGRFLFNNLTIDVRNSNEMAALEALKENLVGIMPLEPQPEASLTSAGGIEQFLDKRSFAARRNVARAIPDYISSQRLPTSNAEPLVAALRTDAGIPLSGLSDNPSYKEIQHAVSTEKFTSGHYNMDNIGNIENLERESLVLSVFYLTQLREYYELLERGVLALAVQTAIDIDLQKNDSGALEDTPASN
ncbi:MAG: hypothetical protein ACQEQL_04255 [Pseudomonadota bacterium]